MKFTKTLRKLKRQLFNQPNHYLKPLLPFALLLVASVSIWFIGDLLHIQSDKRLYGILFIYLIWVFAFILSGFGIPNTHQYRDQAISHQLVELQKRFAGAIQFLKKMAALNHLPWYVLIGPENAGKTALLKNAGVKFTLQKQPTQTIEKSEHCDWWVTHSLSLIDVPGCYLGTQTCKEGKHKGQPLAIFWIFLLRLIKKARGKQAVDGIIIALPLPELMKQEEPKKFTALCNQLFARLTELQKIFVHPTPCQIIITKCDLLSGFNDFFGELSEEETKQGWGISIAKTTLHNNLATLFNTQFDALIKKINQQLIWRLHHERNAARRPFIKDFPLELERLKEYLGYFLNKFATAHPQMEVQHIYLTSALQQKPQLLQANQTITLQETAVSTHVASTLQETPLFSRAYFIKQIIAQSILNTAQHKKIHFNYTYTNAAIYTFALAFIIVAGALLGRDFETGMKHTYAVSEKFADYQLAIQSIQTPDARLLKTITLLDQLSANDQKTNRFTFDLKHLLSFYSHQSDQKNLGVYHHALATILLPNISFYFANYLKTPVNRNTDEVYAALKSYLMLGDNQHLDASFILRTLDTVLPSIFTADEKVSLLQHSKVALSHLIRPLTLDETTIQNTRKYFTSMPTFQLSYVILKNTENNNLLSDISLENMPDADLVFSKSDPLTPLNMFTAKSYAAIITNEATIAAQEALNGNWVIGTGLSASNLPVSPLIEQLKTTYINNYIDTWQHLLTNLRLINTANLNETNGLLTILISSNSPLLQLLKTLHDNTYFEPIASSSPTLQNIGALIDRNDKPADSQLYQIFASLEALHQTLTTVLNAKDEQQAAFTFISNLMQHKNDQPDVFAQLRNVAAKSPAPLNDWLNKIANTAWVYLMQDATRYIDMSWQNKVMRPYQDNIVHHYPFDKNNNQQVPLNQFVAFFGKSGAVSNFYNHYLQALIDTSTPQWHWKLFDGSRGLPFSNETLHQIQAALHIRDVFFPNDSNKLAMQFVFRPYKIDDTIKKVTLSIGDQSFTDKPSKETNTALKHVIAWPTEKEQASVAFTLPNKQTVTHDFPGAWGFYKLVSQSFDSALNKKQLIINLSVDTHLAKYLVSTDVATNPFLALDLSHFKLDTQISERG